MWLVVTHLSARLNTVVHMQDVTIRHVTIASNLVITPQRPAPAPSIPLMYIGVAVAHDAGGEWYRGHIKMDTLTLFGTDADAIKIVGTGFVDIHNLHAGGTGDQSFYGGPGVIGGRCVNVVGPEADVVVSGAPRCDPCGRQKLKSMTLLVLAVIFALTLPCSNPSML